MREGGVVGERLMVSASVSLIQVTPRYIICFTSSNGCSAVIRASKRTHVLSCRLKRVRGVVNGRLNNRNGVFVHVNGDLVVGHSCVCCVGVPGRGLVLSSMGKFGRSIATSGRTLGRLGRLLRERAGWL